MFGPAHSASRRAQHFLLTSIVNYSWRVIFWTRPARAITLRGPRACLSRQRVRAAARRAPSRIAVWTRHRLSPNECRSGCCGPPPSRASGVPPGTPHEQLSDGAARPPGAGEGDRSNRRGHRARVLLFLGARGSRTRRDRIEACPGPTRAGRASRMTERSMALSANRWAYSLSPIDANHSVMPFMAFPVDLRAIAARAPRAATQPRRREPR